MVYFVLNIILLRDCFLRLVFIGYFYRTARHLWICSHHNLCFFMVWHRIDRAGFAILRHFIHPKFLNNFLFYLSWIDISNHHDSHQVRTMPFFVIISQLIRRKMLQNFLLANGKAKWIKGTCQ